MRARIGRNSLGPVLAPRLAGQDTIPEVAIMQRRSRKATDWLASALEGARDKTNFPVRSDRHAGDDGERHGQNAEGPIMLSPEERDRLAAALEPRAI
jgi:hypothetical protein